MSGAHFDFTTPKCLKTDKQKGDECSRNDKRKEKKRLTSNSYVVFFGVSGGEKNTLTPGRVNFAIPFIYI